MDENLLIQFLKHAEKVSLSAAAKKVGRERLLAAIEQSGTASSFSFAQMYNQGIFFNFFHMRRTVLAGTLVGALLFTTSIGTSLAAEGALPGGVLYPIKTNVNERVLGSLAFSDQAKIQWQMKRIERRIAEADQLATEGQLKEETVQDIEDLTSRQMQDVDDLVQKLEENNDERAQTTKERLNSTLKSGHRVNVEVSDQKVTITEKRESTEHRNQENKNEQLSVSGESFNDNEHDTEDDRANIFGSTSVSEQQNKETQKENKKKKTEHFSASSQTEKTESSSAKSSPKTSVQQEVQSNENNEDSSGDTLESISHQTDKLETEDL